MIKLKHQKRKDEYLKTLRKCQNKVFQLNERKVEKENEQFFN
jgi:hypothetical protein